MCRGGRWWKGYKPGLDFGSVSRGLGHWGSESCLRCLSRTQCFWKPSLAGSRQIGWGRRELSQRSMWGECCCDPNRRQHWTQSGGEMWWKGWWWVPSKKNLFSGWQPRRSKHWLSQWWRLCGPSALSYEQQGWQANARGTQCPEMLAAMVSAHWTVAAV